MMVRTFRLLLELLLCVLAYAARHEEGSQEQEETCENSARPLHHAVKVARGARELLAGKSYELRFVDPIKDSAEWMALQKMVAVREPDELGKGRDAANWFQALFNKGGYSDLVLMTAAAVDYHHGYSTYGDEKARMRSELKKEGKHQFERIPWLPSEKSRDLMELQRKLNRTEISEDLNEVLLLHGTKEVNIKEILKRGLADRNMYRRFDAEGYTCPRECEYDRRGNIRRRPCHQNMFGCGVYMSDDIDKIDQYCVPLTSEDIYSIDWSGLDMMANYDEKAMDFFHKNNQHIFYAFVVRALLGNIKVVKFPPGDYAHFSNGFYNADGKKYHSQFIPRKSRKNKRGLRYHEVTAAADGSRTEIAYIFAFARCTMRHAIGKGKTAEKAAFFGTLRKGLTDLCDDYHRFTDPNHYSLDWTQYPLGF
eukprot:TRINITY_DN42383_c0_g1_i1.p1 TRINITY_DN42383_c0_g1~~TRINITY_DN42383_c0_g1_i1.p1  ORF type:complete len:423 (-),score=33.33 TRINITY_DN42383_c0_g1_i1:55-1323(-)